MKRIAFGQAGGPTAVLNASLAGFINDINADVYGISCGFQGLVDQRIHHMDAETIEKIKLYQKIPGAFLGAGRFHMDDLNFIKAINCLKENKIDTLVFSGGNGTMWTLYKMSEIARSMNYELQVIGIPKTVDNDLAETDHAPGFGSAARYVAASVRDISKDLEAMRNFEQVRIVETMGRNVGWLAAAGGLLKEDELEQSLKIYIPEKKLSVNTFIFDVKEMVKKNGFAMIVVSEGVTLDAHQPIEKAVVGGRKILGGISTQLAEIVKDELGFMARDEILGMNQRSSQMYVSKQDRLEAYQAGRKAAELVNTGYSNVMVAIERVRGFSYNCKFNPVKLQKVADGGERSLPKEFLTSLSDYYRWLRPLVGTDLKPFPQSTLKRREKIN